MHKLLKTVIIAMPVILVLGGCSRSGDRADSRYLTVKGSDTMVHLASNWAEAYMQQAGAPDVSVTGGGSGTGIAALLNGTTDICIASREIKPEELELAAEQGLEPVETTVARDGIAVIVNPANPLNELTLEQIEKIYIGAYTNWQQAGGPDANVIVLSRESSSGTYVFFQERVLNRRDYTPAARLMPATSAIIRTVSEDDWAIGYVGLGYALEAGDAVKILGIKETAESVAILPSLATVRSGEYPIARALYIYTSSTPAGNVKELIDFALGPAGRQIVTETGYVPVQ